MLAAVVIVISEDWSSWIALVRMPERWPGLSFNMIVGYLDMVRQEDRRWVREHAGESGIYRPEVGSARPDL